MSKGAMALEELLEQGYRKLAQDKARMGGLNYPAYKGETLAPMSDLTQRARGLQEYYSGRPAPYSGKISSVLSRQTGLGEDRTSGLLSGIGNRQRDYGSSLLGNLQKEFRSSYTPRVERFRQKSEKDIGRGLGEFRGRLGDINTLSRNLDQSSNQATAKALQGLSGQKQARRNLLIDNLEQFGSQKHALANLKNQADRASFDAEVNDPYDKANKLEQVLNNANNQMQSGGIHRDLEQSMANQINQAMSAYNTPYQKYPGKLIADSNAELNTSQDLMGRLSPKFRDSFYPERKELTNQLTGPNSVSQGAMDKVPESIQGQIDQLEYAGGKRLKSDLGRLANKYTRLGQYGSPGHMSAAEERAREINQSILEQRNKLTEGGLKNQLQMQHQSNIGDIKQLGMLGELGQQEFGDSIKTIRDLNRLGSTKWQNKQAENEELYKNFQNEAMWMWPHMKGQAMKSGRYGALADVFNTMQNNNISLENLANLNTNYQEMQKENDKYSQELANQSNKYQGQIDSQSKLISSLQGQLRNQQAEDRKRQLQLDQQRKAEMDRQAQLRKQQQDAQNLANQKRSQEEARINNLFKDMTIYDSQRMRQDIENLPYRDSTTLSWHPAAHFLRNYNNEVNFPGLDNVKPTKNLNTFGRSGRYGMTPTNIVNHYFSNHQNYPSGYINSYGYYKPPTINLANLRGYHGFKKGGSALANMIS